MAGLARARQAGTHLGRKFTEDTKEGSRKVKAALAMRAKGVGYRKIAKEVGLGVGTVMRLTASQDINRPFRGRKLPSHNEEKTRPSAAKVEAVEHASLCLLIGVNRPLLLRCGNACFCEGFRMTAHRDGSAGTGAGVRKPPKNEPAVCFARCPRSLMGI